MKYEVFIERLTSPEVNNLIEKGHKNVVLMIGAMEQHGPHLPIATDTLSAYTIGELVARSLKNTLVAPILPIGYSPHHMSFPGTITFSKDTLVATVKESCHSLSKHGFKNIVIITTHGGNIGPILERLEEIKTSVKSQVEFIILDNFDSLVDTICRKNLGSKLDKHEVHSCHACLHETSFMMAFYPDSVRTKKVEQGRIYSYDHKALLEGGDIKDISPNGILGDPTLAYKDLGKELTYEVVKADIKKIRDLFSTWE